MQGLEEGVGEEVKEGIDIVGGGNLGVLAHDLHNAIEVE